MTFQGWAEIALTLALAIGFAWPLGVYMARVWQGQSTWLDPVLRPVEKLFYGLSGVDPKKAQGWLTYAISLLAFNAAGFILLYAILRLQNHLPLNPQGFGPMSPDLAFNTAISFVSNTNWQAYSGESAASHFSQMAGLTVQNFVSAATGIAVAAALARAFAANRGTTVGNFWADLVRNTLYVLLPLAIVFGLLLAALGIPQTLLGHIDATTMEGAKQTLMVGPIASQEIIKQLGTNGGGFFGANSAHPFENPSSLTNSIEIVAMLVVTLATAVAFGVVAGARKEAWALIAAMIILVGAGASGIYVAETRTTPAMAAAHITGAPNMEGKEVRFGPASSSLFAAVTTGISDGAIDAQHESLTPAGGGVAMFLMQLGELAPGGVGSGLYAMVHMALLAVFVAGLMVGRTPEYLGKKVEAREIKYVMLSALIMTVAILGFAAVAAVLPLALKGLAASGPHGLSELLYNYTSATANNGSAFGGMSANSPWFNITTGIAMMIGRYGYAIPVLAVAGSIVAKPKLAPTAGTLPTHNGLFIGLLVGVVIILGGLQFFPALALGPIVEHFQMLGQIHALAAAH
jgi:K+-transporting ATPase ATPase A chain